MPSIWYKREISNKLRESAKYFSTIVLTGARQSGKTSLLRRLFPHHNYVCLDIPITAEMADKEPRLCLDTYPPPVLIDEVQYAPKLGRYDPSSLPPSPHLCRSFCPKKQMVPLAPVSLEEEVEDLITCAGAAKPLPFFYAF